MKKALVLLVLVVTFVTSLSAKSLKDLAKGAAKKALGVETQKKETSEPVALTNEIALYSFLKGTNADLTNEYLPYAKTIENDVWEKYHNDPFEWDEKFAECKKNFDSKVENVNLEQEYVLSTVIELGDFDFENLGYKVSIPEGTYFPMKKVSTTGSWTDAYPGDDSYFINNIGLKIQDLTKYNFVPMSKDDGKKFLQSRKNSYGNINSKVTIFFKYKLASFDSKEYNEFAAAIANEGRIPLVGIIQGSIEVLDDKNNYAKIGELIIK